MINLLDATVEAVLFALITVISVRVKLYFSSQGYSSYFFSHFCSFMMVWGWSFGFGILDWVFEDEVFS